MSKEQNEKKIIIDLNNKEQTVDFTGKLGVADTLALLEILNDIEKQMQQHLMKVLIGSHIEFGKACAIKKELEQILTPEEAINLITDIWEKD